MTKVQIIQNKLKDYIMKYYDQPEGTAGHGKYDKDDYIAFLKTSDFKRFIGQYPQGPLDKDHLGVLSYYNVLSWQEKFGNALKGLGRNEEWARFANLFEKSNAGSVMAALYSMGKELKIPMSYLALRFPEEINKNNRVCSGPMKFVRDRVNRRNVAIKATSRNFFRCAKEAIEDVLEGKLKGKVKFIPKTVSWIKPSSNYFLQNSKKGLSVALTANWCGYEIDTRSPVSILYGDNNLILIDFQMAPEYLDKRLGSCDGYEGSALTNSAIKAAIRTFINDGDYVKWHGVVKKIDLSKPPKVKVMSNWSIPKVIKAVRVKFKGGSETFDIDVISGTITQRITIIY